MWFQLANGAAAGVYHDTVELAVKDPGLQSTEIEEIFQEVCKVASTLLAKLNEARRNR